jgi:rare lipoprotein A
MEQSKLSMHFETLRLCSGLLLLLFLVSCSPLKSGFPSIPDYPQSYQMGKKGDHSQKQGYESYKETGIASWYGEDFHGKETSSGEIYDMHALTAAHKTLPLGTYVRVTNLHNHRPVVVKINDRGPFVKERIIDLSYRAAQELDMVKNGTALVELKALGRLKKTVVDGKVKQVYTPANYYVGEFTIQLGSFKEKTNATNLVKRLGSHYNNVYISLYKTGAHTFHRVRVARCKTLEEAREIEQDLVQDGYPEAIVVSP